MGKLITFWSPFPGKSGTTAGMCAIAAMYAIQNPTLEIAVSNIGKREENTDELLKYFGIGRGHELQGRTGMTAMRMNYMQAVLTSEKIRRCSVPLLLDNMYLFPGEAEGMDVKSFRICLEKLINEFEVTFLDIVSGNMKYAMEFMKCADMAVVMLPQGESFWKDFDKRYGPVIEKIDCYIVLGKYLSGSRHQERHFMQYQSRNIKLIGSVPATAMYLNALEDGRVLEFCFKNQFSKKNEEQYEFMESIKKVVQNIGEYTNKARRKKIFFF